VSRDCIAFIFRVSHSPGLLDPEDEGTVTLHMSETTCPVTQRHLPKDAILSSTGVRTLSLVSLTSLNVV